MPTVVNETYKELQARNIIKVLQAATKSFYAKCMVISMINKASLERELPNIRDFFTSMTGIELDLPELKISYNLKDVKEYWENTISINPNYLKSYNQRQQQKLTYKGLLSHAFFHHAQHTRIKFYDPSILWSKLECFKLTKNQIQDLVNNIFETTAMFFAVSYLTKTLYGHKKQAKILKYLNSESYAPPRGNFFKGNDIIILFYTHNKYNVAKTIKQTLTYYWTGQNGQAVS